jgi:hypothetical protein
MNRFYNPKFVYSMVPGALISYDLPDLEASLAPRTLLIANVSDGNGQSIDIPGIYKELDPVKAAYHFRNADGQLNIVWDKSTGKIFDHYLQWMK